MAETLLFDEKIGTYHRVIRNDAVKLRNPDRWWVPTTNQTKWVGNWDEFRAAGGVEKLSEDQTSLELTLPEPYKFSCQFPDQ